MRDEYNITAAETSMAQAIAHNPECVVRLSEHLQPEHVADHRVRTVYTTAIALCASRPVVIAADIWAAIEARTGASASGAAWWNAICRDAYTDATVEHHARLIRSAARLRAVQKVVMDAATVIDHADPGDPDAAVREISDRIMNELGEVGEGGRVGLGDALAMFTDVAIDNTNKRAAGQAVRSGWPTSFAAIDGPLHGGLRAGEMYTIGARPKVGKTAFAFAVAAGLATRSRVHVLYMAWEDQPMWLGGRLASSQVRRKGMSLYSGWANEDQLDELVALREAGRAKGGEAPTLNDLMTIVHKPGAGVEQVEREIVRYRRSRAERRVPLALVVVDHIGRLIRQDARNGQDAELRRVAGALESYAKRHDVAVLVCSQLNRDSVKHGKPRPPSAADVRGSDALLEFSSALMFVHRPSAADPDYKPREEAHLIIEANRLGDVGRYPLRWDDHAGVYTDAANEWQTPERDTGGKW